MAASSGRISKFPIPMRGNEEVLRRYGIETVHGFQSP